MEVNENECGGVTVARGPDGMPLTDICPTCCGSGTDYNNNPDPDNGRWDCPNCQGTGGIPQLTPTDGPGAPPILAAAATTPPQPQVDGPPSDEVTPAQLKKEFQFNCEHHPDQPVTHHRTIPEGGYRRACPLCPPDVDVTTCNAARNIREATRAAKQKRATMRKAAAQRRLATAHNLRRKDNGE